MKKISTSVLIFLMVVFAGAGISADTYKNSIVDLEFTRELNNTINVTIYTGKPYGENVFITKRNATTHVILFPETKSAIKSGISTIEAEGLIKKFDIKTQPYTEQSGKGYTKITLTTPENVTILAQTEVYKEDLKPRVSEVISEPVRTQKPQTVPQTLPQTLPQSTATKIAQTKTKTTATAKSEQFDIINPKDTSTKNLKKLPPDTKSDLTSDTDKIVSKNSQSTLKEINPTEPTNPEQEVEANSALEQEALPAVPPRKPLKNGSTGSIADNKFFWLFVVGSLLGLLSIIYILTKRKMKELIGEDDLVLTTPKVTPTPSTSKHESPTLKTDKEKETKINLYKLLNSEDEKGYSGDEDNNYGDEMLDLIDKTSELEGSVSDSEILSGGDIESEITVGDIVIEEPVDINDLSEEAKEGIDTIESEIELEDIVIEELEETQEEEPEETKEEELEETQEEELEKTQEEELEETQETELEETPEEDLPRNSQIDEIVSDITETDSDTPENSIDNYMKYLVENPEKLTSFTPNKEMTDILLNSESNKPEETPEKELEETQTDRNEELQNEQPEETVTSEEELLDFEAEITPESLNQTPNLQTNNDAELEDSTSIQTELQEQIDDNFELTPKLDSAELTNNENKPQPDFESIEFYEYPEEEFTQLSGLKESEFFTDFEEKGANSLFERNETDRIFAKNNSLTDNEEPEIIDPEPIFAETNGVFDLSKYKNTDLEEDSTENIEKRIEDDIQNTAPPKNQPAKPETPEDIKILDNGLKIIANINVKKNTGFYLVEFENQVSLLGFKNNDYFPLKTYTEIPPSILQARLTDKIGRKEQYIVRAGNDKMIIEIDQTAITHIMDL